MKEVFRPTTRQTDNDLKKSQESESKIAKTLDEGQGGTLVKEVRPNYAIGNDDS